MVWRGRSQVGLASWASPGVVTSTERDLEEIILCSSFETDAKVWPAWLRHSHSNGPTRDAWRIFLLRI